MFFEVIGVNLLFCFLMNGFLIFFLYVIVKVGFLNIFYLLRKKCN